MAKLQFVCLALLISMVALPWPNLVVGANFAKSMYFDWGSQHSSFSDSGNDATLALDQFSGTYYTWYVHVCECVDIKKKKIIRKWCRRAFRFWDSIEAIVSIRELWNANQAGTWKLCWNSHCILCKWSFLFREIFVISKVTDKLLLKFHTWGQV